jgi:hypothetical protein
VSTRQTTRLELAALLLTTLAVALLSYGVRQSLPVDPDTFWHLESGGEIVSGGGIPQVDTESWYGVEKELPVSSQEWFYDATAFLIHDIGGFELLYAATALLFAALFVLVYGLVRVRGGAHLTSLIVALVAALGTLPFSSARPQSVTYCLLVATAILLEKGRWPWAIPLIVVGANVHGGVYPLYLVLVAFYTLPQGSPALGVSLAAVLFNPQGARLLALPLAALTYTDARLISEAKLTALASRWHNLAAYGGLFLLVRKRDIPARDGLLALAFVVLSLLAVRHVVFFYILVLPLMARYVRATPEPEPSGAGEEAGLSADVARRFDLLVVVLLAVAVAVGALKVSQGSIDEHEWYPRAAMELVRAEGLDRVLNEYTAGGYLMFHGVPPMIDGRFYPFTPALGADDDLFKDYADVVFEAKKDYRPFLEEHDITYVLLRDDAALTQSLLGSADAEVLLEEDGFILFEYAP